jgi:3-hydroxyisobutyrate dehydrogenase
LLDKDVAIARELVETLGLEAPMIATASELLHQARAALGEEADHVEALKLHERRAGVELRG